MEEKSKKSIASLGSIAGSIRKESSPQKESVAPERIIEIRRPHFPPAPPSPVSIKLDNLRALDDDTLMKLLTSEIGSGERPLSDGTKMAITAELMRRQAKRAERAAWWKDPYFWVGAIAAIGAVIAAVPVLTSPPRTLAAEAPSKSGTAPAESPRSISGSPPGIGASPAALPSE